MAFGNEIRFKIGGDASSLERTFERAARKGVTAANTMDRAVKKMLGSAEMRLQDKLGAAREKRLYNEATTVGKIAIVTRELQDYAYARSQSQKNSVAYLRAELAIEERLTRLRGLQQQQQSANAGGASMAQQSGSVLTGVAGNLGMMAFRAIGGAIAFVLERAIAYNASRVAVDEARGQSAAEATASMSSTFAQRVGLEGAETAGQSEMKGLKAQREMAKNRVNFLSSGVQGIASFFAPGEKLKAEQEVSALDASIQKQADSNELITRQLNKHLELYDEERRNVDSINVARSKGRYNELTASKMIANNAMEKYRILRSKKEGGMGLGTAEEADAAALEAGTALGNVNAARQAMVQRQRDVSQSLSEQALTGRTFANGSRRPRSETERLAERAAMFRERSRSMILTGAGQGAASALQSARKDEGAVGDRLSRATSAMPQRDVSDLTKLPTLIENSNQLLTAIKESLRVNVVQVGNKK